MREGMIEGSRANANIHELIMRYFEQLEVPRVSESARAWMSLEPPRRMLDEQTRRMHTV